MARCDHDTLPVNNFQGESEGKQEAYVNSLTGKVSGKVAQSEENGRGTGRAQAIEMNGAGGRNRTDMVLSTTGF